MLLVLIVSEVSVLWSRHGLKTVELIAAISGRVKPGTPRASLCCERFQVFTHPFRRLQEAPTSPLLCILSLSLTLSLVRAVLEQAAACGQRRTSSRVCGGTLRTIKVNSSVTRIRAERGAAPRPGVPAGLARAVLQPSHCRWDLGHQRYPASTRSPPQT